MSGLIGQRLGQYEIISILGEGGMAVVYRAHQTSMRRDVAIKVIESRLARNPDFVRRFEREAQTVAALNHPHILKVFDYGQQEEVVYLVMELHSGGSLAELIRQGPLSLDIAAHLFDQIALALDYAHQRGIIHRDLKPQNVLLDSMNNAILTDFGIAKILSETTALTQSGAAMGTPAYMPPEQWHGLPLDSRADVYALGVMLFEMLSGKLPFNADSPATMMFKHLQETPPSIRNLRADLPPGVEAVIDKALAKDAAGRFSSAGEMASSFKETLTEKAPPAQSSVPSRVDVGGPTRGGIDTAIDVAHDPPWRKRLPLIVAGIAVIAVTGVLVIILSSGGRSGGPSATMNPTITGAAVMAADTAIATRTIAPTQVPSIATVTSPGQTSTQEPNLETLVTATLSREATQTTIAVASFTKTPTPGTTLTDTQLIERAQIGVTRNAGWSVVIRDFDGVPMVLVPKGCFLMGSQSGGGDDERPTAKICIDKPYWIDKLEVSNTQFKQFKGKAGRQSNHPGDNRPREQITWFEARDFCTAQGGHLPTEAEWEYTARGPDSLVYPWGNALVADNVVYSGNSGGQTADIGSKLGGASWVGALDMSGNVWEWVSTLYKSYPYNATDGRENSSDTNSVRVLRGGSWYGGADGDFYVRAAVRYSYPPSEVHDYLGFRCARSY